jgi:hypothetical protein
MSALPQFADIDLLSYRQRIVDFHTQIPHRAFNLRMTEEQLDRS